MTNRIEGHALIFEGAPFDDSKRRVGRYGASSVAGEGRGLCECGVLSDILPSAYRRKMWHRNHKANVGVAAGTERHAALTDAIMGARWPDGDTSGLPTRRGAEIIAAHLIEVGVVS